MSIIGRSQHKTLEIKEKIVEAQNKAELVEGSIAQLSLGNESTDIKKATRHLTDFLADAHNEALKLEASLAKLRASEYDKD